MKPSFFSDRRFADSIRLPAMLIACLWIVMFFERISGFSLHQLGILPRDVRGVAGIVLSPFLHGSLGHLFSNTGPFFMLLAAMQYFYPKATQRALPAIYLFTGLGVWLFARGTYMENDLQHHVYHIGASGLIYGFGAFLFLSGLLRHDRRSWAISLVVAFLYHGLLYGIVPNQEGISWESHLIGALVGLATAIVLRKYDRLPRSSSGSEYLSETGFRPIQNKHIRYTYLPPNEQN